MIAATIPTPTDLAADLLKKYGGGIANLSKRAGWQRDDARQQCWVAAAEAINGYDKGKGDLLARAWFYLQIAAKRAGFLPCNLSTDANEISELDKIQGGDDPAEILAAVEKAEALGFEKYVERIANSKSSGRRHAARARGAAEALISGGQQGDLFTGGL
jgi:hypothetical protein